MSERTSVVRALRQPTCEIVIPIVDVDGGQIGELSPFKATLPEDNEIVELLCAWRNSNRDYFITTDPTTPERTRSWLREQVLSADDRAMFWIESGNIKYGHIGFRNLTEWSAEPDNLIRGREGGARNLVERAKISMLRWMFANLGIQAVTVRVLKRAAIARMIYQHIGYQTEGEADEKTIVLRLDRIRFAHLHGA